MAENILCHLVTDQVQAHGGMAGGGWRPLHPGPLQPGHQHPGEQVEFESLTQVTTFLGRTLAEFWHWFVANIPGDSVEDGEVTFATTTFPQDVSSLGHF